MWKETYKSRLMSADEAVKLIKSGDRVIVGHAVGEPTYLLDAMVANAAEYENVEIVHMVAMGKPSTAGRSMQKTSDITASSLAPAPAKLLKKAEEILHLSISAKYRNLLRHIIRKYACYR